MSSGVLIVVVLIQLIVLIVFFVMASNVSAIKNELRSKKVEITYRQIWVLVQMGKKDEAYELVSKSFFDRLFYAKYANSLNNHRMPEEEVKKFKGLFELCGKDIPEGYDENLPNKQ